MKKEMSELTQLIKTIHAYMEARIPSGELRNKVISLCGDSCSKEELNSVLVMCGLPEVA